MNASVFFTIFQTFMSGNSNQEADDWMIVDGSDKKFYFGEYPPDFFDLIIVDECHRGGATMRVLGEAS